VSRIRPFLLFLAMSAIVATASIVSLVVVNQEPDVLASNQVEEIVTMAPREVESDSAVQATLSVEVTSWRTVMSGRDGVVTSISVGPGDVLTGGDVLLGINDHPVAAFTSPAPLVRELGIGMRGDDVSRLQAFLVSLEGLDLAEMEVDGSYGRSTGEAVRRFRVSRGMADITSIGPGDLVWVGDSDFTVTAVNTEVGRRVSSGEPLITGPPAEVARTIDGAPLDSTRSWSLTVDDLTLPISPDMTISDQDALRVWQTVGDQEAVPALIRLNTPIKLIEVPATAIWSDGDNTCMFDGDTLEPIIVEVVDAAFGQARLSIPGPTATTSEVVINPEVIDGRTCNP